MNIRFRSRLVAWTFAAAALSLPLFAEVVITSATLTSSSADTTLVLESATPIHFSLLALRNPQRLLLDLDGISNGVRLSNLPGQLLTSNPAIKALRIQPLGAGTVRLEFDMRIEALATTQNVKTHSGYRLLVALTAPDGSALAHAPGPLEAPHPATAVNSPFPVAVLQPAPVTTAMPSTPTRPVAAAPPAPPAPSASAIKTPLPTISSTANPSGTAEELLLAVQVNRLVPARQLLVIRQGDGQLLLRGQDLLSWQIKLPQSDPVSHVGERFYPLSALTGVSFRQDDAALTLVIEVPANLFVGTTMVGHDSERLQPPPAPMGGFANYDVVATSGGGRRSMAGLFELGAFNALGSGVSQFTVVRAGDITRVVRLDTTWVRDDPAAMTSLRLGDAIARSSTWGNAVRFGGLQWGTNFATQPGLITFPLPALAGEAATPSTVDLYVNNALRLRRDVPTGPFSIQDLPVITGQGDMRLVVRDVLGREQVVNLPFFASARLLQQGLHDYSYEIGAVRNNYTVSSNDYGPLFASAVHRLGITDKLTLEGHAQAARDRQTVGVSAAFGLPGVGLFSGAAAASRHDQQQGWLLASGFERSTTRVSFGVNVQAASAGFVQLGMAPGTLSSRLTAQTYTGFNAGSVGNFALSYTHQTYRDQRADVKLLNASYSRSLGTWGYVSISALQSVVPNGKTVFAVNLSVPLGNNLSSNAVLSSTDGKTQAQVSLQKSLPAGTGYGYQLRATAGNSADTTGNANLYAQNDYGNYRLGAAVGRGQTGFEAGASGGVAILGGNLFASRRVDSSFALVDVPGFPGVGIYSANQLVGSTNSDGQALVPRLLPYQRNKLRIETNQLPLDTQIGAPELEAVPYFRSGMHVKFDVKRVRGGTLSIFLEDGRPMPAGAVAVHAGNEDESPVGMDGELYLIGLSATNSVRVTWRGQPCDIKVNFPVETAEPIPDLGTYTCKGIKR